MDYEKDSLDPARWQRQMELHLETVAIAKKVWEDLLTRNARDEITWLRLGHAYMQLGDNPAAIACLILSNVFARAGKAGKILGNLVQAETLPILGDIEKKVRYFLDLYHLGDLLDKCLTLFKKLVN